MSVGEGEPLLEKLLLGQSLEGERCFQVGEPPRSGLIHEQPESRPKTACNYSYIASIWPQLDWYLEGGDFYVASERFSPKKGSAIIFPSNFMFPHEAEVVTKGTRWSIVTWLM